jgi:hypothetical protein
MYSNSSIAVDKKLPAEGTDKGLGFDFSGIANLVKSALPVGLNIFQNQAQLKQIKAMQRSGYTQSPGVYGNQYGILPMSQVLQPQPTFGGQYAQPSTGIGTGTMLAIGGAVVVGLLAFKMLR